MHGDADKRVVLGSDKPCEGVATSLRFPSQPGSFTPGNYGSEAGPPDGQPDSPIKTSPVSERIKALEALAAKKKEPDFRSDGGFSHFRDRHHEKSPADTQKSSTETPKSPTDKITPTVPKRGGSADQESPESPFEVLGDLRQVNEFEETEEWMKAHLPPVPDFDAVDLIKSNLTSDNVASKEEKAADIVPDAPAAFAGVPDAFMDSPVEAPKLKDEFSDAQKQPSIEEESEFDLSFLPTAYMWDQQEKSGVQAPSNLDSVLPASPAPPAGFGSPSPPVFPPVGTDSKQNASDDKKATWTGEASEADSSGESDDTVIEDGVTVPASVPPPSSDPAVSNDPTTIPASAAPNLPTEEKETPPPKSERKLMQVPTINVIETDEPNYSEEEMDMELEAEEDEDYEVVKDPAREAPKTPEPEDSKNEPPKTRPLETEFMEGYSPPSSPVDSDAEYSPKHKILKSLSETVHQESASQPEAIPNQTDSKGSVLGKNQMQSEKSQTTSNKVNDEPSPCTVTNEEVDFPDNDDEWSDEAQDILVKPSKTDFTFMEPTPYTPSKVDEKGNTTAKETLMETASLSKTSFMQDDIYDRQSFDYDYDASSPLDDVDDKGLNNAKERFLSDPSQIHVETLNASTAQNDVPEDSQNLDDFTSVNDDEAFPKPVGQPSLREYPQDPYSSFQSETLSNINEQDFSKKMTTDIVTDNMPNGNSLPAQKIGSKLQPDTKAGHHAPDTTSNPESIDTDSSVSEPTDSFVEFMRECLKSRQDEEPDDMHQGFPSKNEFCKTGLPPSQSPPTMVMDLEQEQLTISALKELGSSQEEEELASLQSKVPDQDKANPNATSIQQSSFTSVPSTPCSQSNRVFDSTYSKEVEAIDEWVAEAYHLAEHVLTAILTHLSGNTIPSGQ